MPNDAKYISAGKTLRCAGLQPSDYYLFKSLREYFDFDMRQLLTLGDRWIYAGMHDPKMLAMIQQLAVAVKQADLDVNDNIIYEPIAAIVRQQSRR